MRPPPPVTDVGILAMSVYIPRTCVSQAALEAHDRAPPGKYTAGLGQARMSFVSDREDVVSLALTAVDDVVRAAGLTYAQIGRLEVGTETLLDKSKSVKSSLMRLFAGSGNADVEGLDNTNACYGGTAALFNSLAWAESSAWDGRHAVVVMADVAVYEPGPARPTGGAAAVALVLARAHPAAALRFEVGLRATCMGDTYDFFKPRVAAEYPVVDGPATVDTYVAAMDACYDAFRPRAERADARPFRLARGGADYAVFHAPFNKMVVKSFARLLYSDFLATDPGADRFFAGVEAFRGLPRASAHRSREATQAFVRLARPLYERMVAPGAWLGVEIGNCYTASLYASLAALVADRRDALVGKRVLMYSFGSGFAASMFSLRVTAPPARIYGALRLRERLAARVEVPPEEFERALARRERDYGRFGYEPETKVDTLFPGTFYLKSVGKRGERDYGRVPFR